MSILQKIIAFIMTILAFFGIGTPDPVEPQVVSDDISAYSVEQDAVTFSFVANPSTGYGWEYVLDGDSVVLTDESYKSSNQDSGVAVAGAPGRQYYTFAAAKPGTTTVTFTYARSWETDPPAHTYIAVISVAEDMSLTLDSFKSA